MSQIPLGSFHGLDALELRSGDGSAATVLLHGAQLVSWQPAGRGEQLYLSPDAVFDGVAPVRGGVPVIFPQFDRRGDLPKHGFARDRSWRALSLESRGDDALAVLRLVDDEATRAVWPHGFVAELSVHLSPSRVDIELAIEHRLPDEATSAIAPLRFTAALHSYLRVADASAVGIEGLQRLRYYDKVASTEQVETRDVLRLAGELDRIYFDVGRPLLLRDGERGIDIAQHGFDDVVVWNPGPQLSARLDDLPDDGWREMVCVEAAAIGRPVEVGAGDCWIGRQTLMLRPR